MMVDTNKQIKIGAVISYCTFFINTITALLYIPWMVSKIGKSNYALYTLASSFIGLFLIDIGLNTSVSRYVAKYRAENNENKINEFISTVEQLYLVIAAILLLVLAALYFCLGYIYKGLTASELYTFRHLYIIVATYSVISFPFMPLGGIINAYERFIQQKICDLFQKLFAIILIVIALMINAKVEIILIAHAISGLVTIIIKLVIVRKETKISFVWVRPNKAIAKQALSFSLWITIICLSARCMSSLAPTILGIVSDSSEIAILSPANALESYFITCAAAVNGLFLATISRCIADHDEKKIFALMIRVGRYQLVLLGLIYVGFLCAGRDFMIAWMGAEFEKSWNCALLMFIPDIFIYSQQIANTTVIAKNKVKQQAIGYVWMAVICVSLSFVFSRLWGGIGAAAAISIAYVFVFIYMNILYKKELNIDVRQFFKKCYASLLPPIILSGLLSYYISSFITCSGWTAVILKSAVTIVIYTAIMLPSVTKAERDWLLGTLRSVWRRIRRKQA